MSNTDYMSTILKLAEKGCGKASPNPMVGATIVKEGRIISQGSHLCFDGPHAERDALASLTESPRGTTLYITLEPCCYHGKTPPCMGTITESGIRRIIVGTRDPDPMVSDGGTGVLTTNGIGAVEGILEEECRELNHVFFHYIKAGRPLVVMKYAVTLDDKTATWARCSRWITGKCPHQKVHEDRSRYFTVMCGVGAALTGDSLLTRRLPTARNPVWTICNSRLHTPPDSRVATTYSRTRTILATCCPDRKAWFPYREKSCEVLLFPPRKGHVDLNALTEHLGQMGIDSVLLGGSGALNWSALDRGIVNRVQAYTSPRLFGSATAKTSVGGSEVESPYQGYSLVKTKIMALGQDIFIKGELAPCSQES